MDTLAVLAAMTAFNGATTFQPWIRRPKLSGFPAKLSAFNGATTFQPWIRRHPAAIRTAWSPAFNGATTFQPWIRPGPGRAHCRLRPPFNGATTFQPWIRRKFKIFRTNFAVRDRDFRFRRPFYYSIVDFVPATRPSFSEIVRALTL